MTYQPVKLAGTDTGRGPSRSLWNASRYGEILLDPNAGFIFLPFDDFVSIGLQYRVEQKASGGLVETQVTTGGSGTSDYGVVGFGNSTTNNHGITFRQGCRDEVLDVSGTVLGTDSVTDEVDASAPLKLVTGTRVVWEARVQLNDFVGNSGAPEFAIGVSKNDTDAGATGIAAAQDFVGFTNYDSSALSTTDLYGQTTDGASAADQDSNSVLTFATATWYKVGFIIEGTGKVRFFVDGVEKPLSESTTLPDGNESLSAFLSIVNGAASAATPQILIDWWYGVQSFRKG